MNTAEALVALDEAIREAPAEERAALVVQILVLAGQAAAGMAMATRLPEEQSGVECLLTPAQAARVIGGDVSLKWLYRHTKGLRFRRDLSRKCIRFEEAGLRRWIAVKKP